MYQCPECGTELVQDPNNPGKVLCYTCKKRFSEADVANYWMANGSGQSQAVTQPQQAQQGAQYVQQPTMQMPGEAPGMAPQQAPGVGSQQMPPQAPQATQPMEHPQYAPQTQNARYATQPGQQAPDMVIGGNMTPPPAQPGMGGAPAGGYAPNPQLPKGMAIASLVIGILMLLGSWVPLVNIVNIVGAIVALVLGIIAIKKVKQGIGGGKGLAVGGIVTSALTIVVSIAISALTMWAGMAMFDVMSNEETANEILNMIDEADNANDNMDMDEILNTLDNLEQSTDTSSNTSGSESSSTGTAGSSAAIDALLVADANCPWGAMKFSFEDKSFQLGKSTLKDFEASGWKLDLAAAGYPDGFVVNAHSGQSSIPLEKEGADGTVFVSVSNITDGDLDITECVLSSFRYSGYPSGKLATGGINGTDIKLGGDFSAAVSKLPEPADKYESGNTKSYDYEDEGYDRLMDVDGEGNVITGFQLKCFL